MDPRRSQQLSMKALLRSPAILRATGRTLAAYLRLVQRTSRVVVDPPDFHDRFAQLEPAIIALWHGQHLMVPFGRRPEHRLCVLISRHGDGEINAVACEAFGIRAIRGSGAQRADQIRKRGSTAALRGMLSALEAGESVAVTADVPKVSRVAGKGIVLLAKLSGRPIVPFTVVSSRRLDFKSWDAASIGLPFGRLAIVGGEPIRVPADAGLEALEAARLAVQSSLDAVHDRAYALVGGTDPGAGRDSVAVARALASAQTDGRA